MPSPPAPPPPRESSTLLLLREGRGLEVFLAKRRSSLRFMGGMHVFPGGCLDPIDHAAGAQAALVGIGPEEAARRLGLGPELAIAHYMAAIRETHEEIGVLLSVGPTSESVSGEAAWIRMLESGLKLDGAALGYFAHWITPEREPRRFSTRFFLAVAPGDQLPVVDGAELEEGDWFTPEDALEADAAGRITLAFPTRKTLESLRGFPSAQAAREACEGRVVRPILPRIVEHGGRWRILMPGEPGYEETP